MKTTKEAIAWYNQQHLAGDLKNKYLTLLKEWANQIKDWLEEEYESLGEARISPISSEPCDGYIPYTDGGWDIWGTVSLDMAHSCGDVPAGLSPKIDNIVANAKDEFCDQVGREWHPEDCHDLNYAEIESSYLMEACYHYRAKCFIELSKGIATFQAYICCDEYGRDYIGWLRACGGNPDRTIGRWEVEQPLSSLENCIDSMVEGAIAEFRRLQTEGEDASAVT